MSWAEIAGHLTRVMNETPSTALIANKDPCALRFIRLREIGKYLEIHYATLRSIRRGERVIEDPKMQAKLSWFFHAQLRGRLTKEQTLDGKWHIVCRDQESQTHANETGPREVGAARSLPQVVITAGGVRLKV